MDRGPGRRRPPPPPAVARSGPNPGRAQPASRASPGRGGGAEVAFLPVGLKRDLDGARPPRVTLSSPSQPHVNTTRRGRVDLDVGAARHLAAVDVAPENAAGPRVELVRGTHPMNHLRRVREELEHRLRRRRDPRLNLDDLLCACLCHRGRPTPAATGRAGSCSPSSPRSCRSGAPTRRALPARGLARRHARLLPAASADSLLPTIRCPCAGRRNRPATSAGVVRSRTGG